MSSKDPQLSKYMQDTMMTDAYEVAKTALVHAVDSNCSVAMHEMEVLSMHADEDEALLQSGKLTDEQFEKVMQDRKEIRHMMTNLTVKHYTLNLELVLGFCAFALLGETLFRLRAA